MRVSEIIHLEGKVNIAFIDFSYGVIFVEDFVTNRTIPTLDFMADKTPKTITLIQNMKQGLPTVSVMFLKCFIIEGEGLLFGFHVK